MVSNTYWPAFGPAHQRRPMTSPDLSSHHDAKLDHWWFRFYRRFVNDIMLHI